ncbi:pyrroline-5-carboxylate reductase family protein [Cryptosporidium muris RN66]|uniref:Pyrroline-5-carboxylate reductase family protein n=1 Tax=Cryptosporidium muris (strain RN66) TaxID=441375 RepID=B6ACU1_CRYMR|nr:pyrroline-5-carboxylate reductase family protein [Cryptosporidium muris RN66]EEA05945.1 pyrroline-5-carboxylate reductase family protein [Cryptosporidium muris RN66]|eukprot:XP_002140294.1 pyrroline-5-carboxylate reductase family protein [Cryptosporidium muris RN66]
MATNINKKIGFIGSGHIARAIISGMISSGILDCSKVYAADLLHEASLLLKEEMGINAVTNNYQVVENSDIVFLCVRPDVARSVLKSIAQCPLNQDFFTGNKIIISVCAGITIDDIIETFGGNKNLYCVRVMPNMAISVRAGTWLFCENPDANFKSNNRITIDEIIHILSSCGTVHKLSESLFSIGTAISGCGPGLCANILNHLAEAASKNGIPTQLATQLAIEVMYGTSKMLMESKESPIDYQNKVSTKGGATQAGIDILEQYGIGEVFLKCLTGAANRCDVLQREARN